MEQNKNLFSGFKNVYFIGIGGIGMSALARYFNNLGFKVAGYDKSDSDLTNKLEAEGCLIHYGDLGDEIPNEFKNKTTTFVVFTPAIPEDMMELVYFISNEFKVYKRSEVLGILTRQSKGLCVAGTHGKTTTSSMLAHILDHSSWKCNAFLGGLQQILIQIWCFLRQAIGQLLKQMSLIVPFKTIPFFKYCNGCRS